MEINPKDLDFSAEVTADHIEEDDISDASEGRGNPGRRHSVSDSSVVDDQKGADHSANYVRKKWQRYRKNYNDEYFEFFENVCNDNAAESDIQDLQTTQIGAVVWTSEEKNRLFAALSRFGRRVLPQLSNAVTTKSPVEILAYIDAVHSAMIDRQQFSENTKNISMADIPAAVEIGPECENALDDAADALNVWQEQYDIAAGVNRSRWSWLVDRVVAKRLDDEHDNGGENSDDAVNETNDLKAQSDSSADYDIFRLSTMLNLSEDFFMNQPSESVYPHWTSISEPEQRPAITTEAIQVMLDLVRARVREIVKMSIVIANTRLSSRTTGEYTPVQRINQSDIAAALDVLKMPHDAWDFWTGLGRKNKFQIITGSHSKGESRHQVIPYEKAEAVLRSRRGKGRRRSMSIGSEVSSTNNTSRDKTELSEFEIEDITNYAGSSKESDAGSVSSEVTEDEESKVREVIESSESSSAEMFDEASSPHKITQAERSFLLDKAMDEHLEKLDDLSRMAEEERIWQVLEKRKFGEVEDSIDQKIGPRPKTLRKTREELEDWSCTYMAEWEYYGHAVPKDEELEEQTGAKLDQDLSRDDADG